MTRHDSRHWANAFLYCARATSGTLLEMHASYLAMKSSHSGTPIFSPDEVIVFSGVDVVIGLSVLPAVELLLLIVSVLLHPIKMATHSTAKINKVILDIGFSFNVPT